MVAPKVASSPENVSFMTHANSTHTMPSAEILAKFIAIVGEDNAIPDAAAQEPFVTEWRDRYRGETPLVLKPGTVGEVSEILKLANRERVAIVPQAGNTGLVGGQIPRPSGRDVVVTVSRLNRLRALDPSNRHMIVDAGVTLATAQDYARDANLEFPLRIASEGSACIGGAVATNAGGVHVLAHGSMRALTLGLEVVLANGEVWDGLRTLKKDNTGYDLKDLMVGSEGTLGIITAVALKLVPPPTSHATALLGLEKLEDVATLFSHLSATLDANLTAFEFMSAQALSYVVDHIPNARLPINTMCPWTVLIDVSSGRSLDDAGQRLEQALSEEACLGVLLESAIAPSGASAQAFWHLRETISEAQKHGGGSIKHDISVPTGRIADFIPKANALVTKICPGARPCPFGHFGDGNIHYNVSQPAGGDTQDFLAHWEEMQSAVHNLVQQFEGSISAEHGIGVMKRDALTRVKSETEMAMMHAIKQALDPNGILNPGKVL